MHWWPRQTPNVGMRELKLRMISFESPDSRGAQRWAALPIRNLQRPGRSALRHRNELPGDFLSQFGIWSLGFGISPLRVTSATTLHRSAFWFARPRLKQFQLRLLDEIVVLEDA